MDTLLLLFNAGIKINNIEVLIVILLILQIEIFMHNCIYTTLKLFIEILNNLQGEGGIYNGENKNYHTKKEKKKKKQTNKQTKMNSKLAQFKHHDRLLIAILSS